MKNFIALFIFLVVSPAAFAFPELIRHGYVNCTTCHVSPSGGGALNDYGRTFSGEGLSTWTKKGEESIFEGLITREQIPSWLSVGGDLRGVQTYHENSDVREGYWYNMQADAEAAVKVKGLTMDLTLGRFQIAKEEPRLKSRRFFAMYNFTDEIEIRAGRFIPTYGFNLPDHIISTRMPVGFDEGLERYNVEAGYITDVWSGFLTASKGPIELPDNQQENSVTAQLAYAFHDTYKIGVNSWKGQSDLTSRWLNGLWLNFGFNDDWFLMSEWDWQSATDRTANTTTPGFFNYNRLGYEIVHGFSLLGTVEYWATDTRSDATATERYGAGAQWFPRPHFDIQGIWTKQHIHASGAAFEDYAWVMLHYYL